MVRAEDTFDPLKKQVAIKVSHVQYSSIGQQEVAHLRALNAADSLGKDHHHHH